MYLFIAIRSYIGNNTWMGNDGRDDDAKKAYEGVLNIEQKFGTAKTTGDKVQAFLDRVRLRLKEDPFNIDLQDNSKVRLLTRRVLEIKISHFTF